MTTTATTRSVTRAMLRRVSTCRRSSFGLLSRCRDHPSSDQHDDQHEDHDNCIEQQRMRQSVRLQSDQRGPLSVDSGELFLIGNAPIEQGQHLLIRRDQLGLIEQGRGVFVGVLHARRRSSCIARRAGAHWCAGPVPKFHPWHSRARRPARRAVPSTWRFSARHSLAHHRFLAASGAGEANRGNGSTRRVSPRRAGRRLGRCAL